MDPPELPDGLAARFALSPLAGDDLDEVFALATADRVSVLGTSRLARELVELRLTSPFPSTHLGVRTNGRLVQVWDAVLYPGDPEPFCEVNTDPGLGTPPDRDALEAAGWRHIVRWATTVTDDPASGRVRTSLPTLDLARRERLSRLGFVEERVMWVMEAASDAERGTGRTPLPELEIHAGADPRAVHAIFMSGFAGTYGFIELSYDDFVASRSRLPGHDPALWYLATVAGRPAGAMTVTRAAPERSAMQVSELAVLPELRGRGIAGALLHAAFETTRRDGMRLLYLFADSESHDDAPTLYASVGFETVQATSMLTRPLVDP
ncbi:MAG TPA: GNAT family N-acetyltransferase [Lapillicoccus sp.]|uniref:GNAT family N-acetyltransferase n=1 Tax=Lapillicoccus sp. TaxID=1909287 RepID=UPI002F954625